MVSLMIQRLHLQAMKIFDETGMELKVDLTNGLLSIFTRRGFQMWDSAILNVVNGIANVLVFS